MTAVVVIQVVAPDWEAQMEDDRSTAQQQLKEMENGYR